MVLESEVVHPKSLPFSEQRRVVVLRDEGWSWEDIASEVVNLQGDHPTWGNVRNVYKRLHRKSGRVRTKYKNGGRPKKLTPADETWLLKTFLALRAKGPVVSQDLQRLLASRRKVKVEVSLVRKVLVRNGYKWLPRAKKPKYSDDQKAERKKFSDKVLMLGENALRERLTMSMDGCVLTKPPDKPCQRLNYCRAVETHCWRKPGEAFDEDLAGADNYRKQVPPNRMIPLWGGCSEAGFAPIVWHKTRKMDEEVTWGVLRASTVK
jgi:transposase